jgi:hypothetical protein
VDAQEGVAGVAVAVEVVLDLGFLDGFLQEGDLFLQFGEQVRVLVDQQQVGVQLLDGLVQLLVDLDETVQDLFFFRQPGRLLRLAPDGGIGQLGVDLPYLFGLLGYFKETPEGRRFFSSIRRKGFLFVPVPWPDCKRFRRCRQGKLLPKACVEYSEIMKRYIRRGIYLPCILLLLQAQGMGTVMPNGFAPVGATARYGPPDRELADGSIFNYMDGGGIVYLDHGFRALVHREYLDPNGRRITFDRFTMETAAQAQAALADERIAPAGGTPLVLGVPNKGYRFPPDYFIYMVRGAQLIYLHVDDDKLSETLDRFAAAILKYPEEDKQ